MTTFYRVARRRITYREHWRACGDSFTFAVAALAKMLHVARVSSKIVPRLDSLLSVDETQIPRGLAKRCRDVVDECSSWGIQLQFYYRYPSTGDKDPFWTAAMLSQDGLVVAVLSFPESMWPQTTFTCLSRVADGAILGSSDMPHVLDNPPDFDVVYLSDCWAEDIMETEMLVVVR